MNEKQCKLGTESHLSARNEGGGKVKVSIYSNLLTVAAYSSSIFTSVSIQQFIPSQPFYPLFVNLPESLSAQQELFRGKMCIIISN